MILEPGTFFNVQGTNAQFSTDGFFENIHIELYQDFKEWIDKHHPYLSELPQFNGGVFVGIIDFIDYPYEIKSCGEVTIHVSGMANVMPQIDTPKMVPLLKTWIFINQEMLKEKVSWNEL